MSLFGDPDLDERFVNAYEDIADAVLRISNLWRWGYQPDPAEDTVPEDTSYTSDGEHPPLDMSVVPEILGADVGGDGGHEL